MTHRCQHCATPYTEETGIGGFCCAGCQQVYQLIRKEGLDDYYRWQDRVAEPIQDRALAEPDLESHRRIQSEIEESPEPACAVFKVEGMSCMGCAWLIERLGMKQKGLIDVEASLTARTVTLRWRNAEFDLSFFAGELYRFGYRLNPQRLPPGKGRHLSPLALRFWLIVVFTGNACLLALYEQFVMEATLVRLLSLACLCFTILLGVSPYVLTVYRAWQINRWHSDWIPIICLTASLALAAHQVLRTRVNLSMAVFLVSCLICIFLGARWLAYACGLRQR